MAQSPVQLSSFVAAVPEHVSTDLAGKKAILSLKNRTYYTLDDISSPIWDLLQSERRVEEILQTMVRRYDVDAAECERDLLLFLQQLAEQNLISVK